MNSLKKWQNFKLRESLGFFFNISRTSNLQELKYRQFKFTVFEKIIIMMYLKVIIYVFKIQ